MSNTAANEESERPVQSATLADRYKLETIFRESPAAMALWRGPDHVFELVNPSYQAIFGDRQLVGLPLVIAAPELATQEFPKLLTRVFETGKPFVAHEMLARIASTPDGLLQDHYYDFKYVRVVDEHGKPYGVYDHAVDVTDRVLARRAMEFAQERLQSTVKLLHEERDLRERLVAALSHDLRTPLATAKLSAELLIHKKDDSEQLKKASKRIIDNMDRADAMIRDLLDVSRIRGGEEIPLELDSCELTDLVQTVLEDLVSMHGDRFILYAPAEIHGRWDCGAVRRIVENLASNAVKYGARNSPVTITLSSSNATASVAVHNRGNPINTDELSTLFQPFKRGRATVGTRGWGIGLSLVQALVHAHGGACDVTSSAEAGTTFLVRLPLQTGAVSPTR